MSTTTTTTTTRDRGDRYGPMELAQLVKLEPGCEQLFLYDRNSGALWCRCEQGARGIV